jgi:hypothetical protein
MKNILKRLYMHAISKRHIYIICSSVHYWKLSVFGLNHVENALFNSRKKDTWWPLPCHHLPLEHHPQPHCGGGVHLQDIVTHANKLML